MIRHGAHIGAIHRWMQRKFQNGERVTWGSMDVLAGSGLTVFEMEEVAQEIKEALFHEYHVKDEDHKYKYSIFCSGGCSAYQDADTMREIWTCLFRAEGDVEIREGMNFSPDAVLAFAGTADEARAWVRSQA